MSVGESRDVLGAARALVREWSEEGVEVWEAAADAAGPDADAAGPEAAAPEPAEPSSEPAPTRAPEPAAAASPPAEGPALPGLDGGDWPAGTTLEQVREVLGDCTRCRLHEGRTQIVFGDGDPEADLMFVGEGPGEQEDLRGIPFCGRAGELLTQMIEKGLEIPRSSVYICNIVKCRPPGNRTPLADEVVACRRFLDGQIAAVRPKVIVALGKPATSTLLGRDVAITRLRGTWQSYRGIPLMPTFHPAFLLRQYTQENRRKVWEDLKAALTRAREGEAAERG
jgi:DNA polymerase